MSVQILGGTAKGRALLVPKGDLIRPTSVMLKRRLFDSVPFYDDKVFIDLCAGSGSIGLEVLSRGAELVYLVEKNRKVFTLTKKNAQLISSIDGTGDCRFFCEDGTNWLKRFFQDEYVNFSAERKEETILFVDPPYENHQLYLDILELCSQFSFSGELWLESDRQKGRDMEQWGLNYFKSYRQGTSYVIKVQMGEQRDS